LRCKTQDATLKGVALHGRRKMPIARKNHTMRHRRVGRKSSATLKGWRYMDGAKTQSRATGTFFCTASTAFHRFPQSFCEIALANISCRFYYASRLIGKENFTSQFKDGGKGKTEPVNFELNEEVQTFAVQFKRGGKGKTESASDELNWEGRSGI
jgi:hypothetical protein